MKEYCDEFSLFSTGGYMGVGTGNSGGVGLTTRDWIIPAVSCVPALCIRLPQNGAHRTAVAMITSP